MALYYCKKCGRRVINNQLDPSTQKCDCCESKIYPVPEEYLGGSSKTFIKKDLENQFINKFIKPSPEFDQYLFDHRDEILAKQSVEFNDKLAHGKAVMEGTDKGNSYGVTCPYCKATNVRKIGIVSRSISASIFGLGSKKIGKQWHCDHCGSDF